MTPTRRWKPVALAAAAIVGLAGVLVLALTLTGEDDDPAAGGSEDRTASATPTPSETPTETSIESPSETTTESAGESPSETPSTAAPSGDDAAAIAAIGTAFADQGGLGQELGTCVATQLVAQVGVPRLLEMGMLTP